MKTATSPYNLRFLRRGPLAGFMALALAALIGTAIASAQTPSSAGHSTAVVPSARPQAAATPARHGEEEESEAKPNDASHQGIKIHGHWKIDIKNPDGSLSSTHELENSLYDNGTLLSYLLTSRATAGEAEVQLLACATATTGCGGKDQASFYIAETPTGYWPRTCRAPLSGQHQLPLSSLRT
jgi:hypothetical protein